MITAKILISIALVFTALGLASAVTLGRRQRHPSAKPSFNDKPSFSSARSPSAGEADGGDLVQPGLPAVRYFHSPSATTLRIARSGSRQGSALRGGGRDG
ncbi:hypothetical protein BF49_3588 [Bradyrhizobium sp.]|uniref:hypothetical protein n=1 Tax=Bradyrhizobium sp. TaxID=376 RepID=UPI0007C1D791|nr:hypothetical protein [Bradyrhizobium sp.]CUT12508.1 hypothetical protein BF49_3588 [Bradyrhizobium sp.]